jgi:hypothetical protein
MKSGLHPCGGNKIKLAPILSALTMLLSVGPAWGQFATVHIRRVVQDSACGTWGVSQF